MGGSLSAANPVIVAAFRSLLRHQGLIVLALLAIASFAWAWQYTLPAAAKPRPAAAGADSVSLAAVDLAEHPARKWLRVSFGVLWIFDGLLQLQTAMPVGLPTQVVQPAASSSPGWVRHLVTDGTLIWSRHPISAAASAVWIQLGVGVLLLVARRGRVSQLAGLVSVGWGLVVWVFGEAFGGIFGSGFTWLFGAPGAVLLYCVAGAFIALPERAWLAQRLAKSMLAVTGMYFIGMAALQAWPGRGFWQGQANPHATAGGLTAMAQTMSTTRQPRVLSSLISSFASFDAQHGWAVNLAVVIALAGLGVALLSGRRQVVVVALGFGSILCLAVWVVVQDLGFLGGVGTDPNSMVPTLLLLATAYLALTTHAAEVPAAVAVPATVAVAATVAEPETLDAEPEPTVRPGRSRRPGLVVSPVASRLIAVGAAFGIVFVGAVPMAFAAANPRADAIVSEAINGQPELTDTPAAPFNLIDQHGAAVDLASLHGRTIALTFLDPVCTSDCPLIAQQFRQVDEMLGPSAATTTAFIAVVANPTYRDVQFVQAFDAQEHLDTLPNWYFLTGSLAQLTAMWNAYGIEVQTIGSGGMAAHSDTAYVIDGNGHLRSILGADPGNAPTDSASFATLLNQQMRAVLPK
jgi:cytochrome oxidase Cu insertion factor (SCO1/SenC/PrrC family)